MSVKGFSPGKCAMCELFAQVTGWSPREGGPDPEMPVAFHP